MSDKLVEVEPLLSKNSNSTSVEKPEEHKNVSAPITEEPKALLRESSVALKSTIKSNDCGEKPKPEAKINGLKVDSVEGVTEEEALFVVMIIFMLGGVLLMLFVWFVGYLFNLLVK